MEIRVNPNDRDTKCPLILEEYTNTVKKLNELLKGELNNEKE